MIRPPVAIDFEELYRSGRALPWAHIGPLPFVARLAERGQIGHHVLDVGCGTGENALFLAARGHAVVGVDLAPTGIARARAKADAQRLEIDFRAGDARTLAGIEGPFDTAIDAGLLHFFVETDRTAYVAALTRVCRAGAALHLLCFSKRNSPTSVPGVLGLSESELRAAFADGWHLEALGEEVYGGKRFWLTHLARVL